MDSFNQVMDKIGKNSYVSVGLLISIVGVSWLGGSSVGKIERDVKHNRDAIEKTVPKELYNSEMDNMKESQASIKAEMNDSHARIEAKLDAVILQNSAQEN